MNESISQQIYQMMQSAARVAPYRCLTTFIFNLLKQASIQKLRLTLARKGCEPPHLTLYSARNL